MALSNKNKSDLSMSLRSAASQELQQQLQRQLRTLTVEKLKKILRNSELTVTGTKAILVERISNELYKRSQDNDIAKFTRLRHLIQNPDNPPPPLSGAASVNERHDSYGSPVLGAGQSNGISGSRYAHSTHHTLDFGTIPRFKQSPFYTIQEPIGSRRQLDARESTRDVLDFSFRLRGDIADQTRRDRKLRVLIYSGTDDSLRGPGEIVFPSNFELKVNGSEIRANFKGLKNKPGTTRPVDITSLLSQGASHDNQVWITWALTSRKYHIMLYLAWQSYPEELVQKLKDAKRISRASVISEMSSWADDSEITATSSRISLKCPLSTMRIETPCRSRICKHNQCFDALSFLQLQEQAPQWNCPVCNKNVPFEILQVDDYVDEVLGNTPRTAEQVNVEPDGRWSLVKEDGDPVDSPPRVPKREQTGMSDDIIEIFDGSTSGTPSSKPTSFPYRGNTPIGTPREQSSAAVSLSSAAKRTVSEVIDLTADTDEEEDAPVRPPAKRHITDGSNDFDYNLNLQRPSFDQSGYQGRFSFTMPKQVHQPPGTNFGN